MNVLVAGGAGYIGSHAVKHLLEAGHRVLAVDNLCRGHRQAVDRPCRVRSGRPGRYPRTDGPSRPATRSTA